MTTFWHATLTDAGSKNFTKRFETLFGGGTPNANAMQAYDAMRTMITALARAPKNSTKPVKDGLDTFRSKAGEGVTATDLDRTGVVSKAWLNFENPLGERMLQFLAVLRHLRPPFVSFTLHSSSLLPGGSPYNRTATDVARMLDRADNALKLLRDWPEFQPATMTEIATHLETTHR